MEDSKLKSPILRQDFLIWLLLEKQMIVMHGNYVIVPNDEQTTRSIRTILFALP